MGETVVHVARNTSADNDDEAAPPSPKRVNTRLAQFVTRDADVASSHVMTMDTKIEAELTMYFTQSINDYEAMRELQWWVSKRESLPLLAECAFRLIGTPASSAASERLWSTLGNM